MLYSKCQRYGESWSDWDKTFSGCRTMYSVRGPLSPVLCCLTEFCRFSFPMLLHFWKQNVVLYCLPQFEPKTFFLNNFHTVWFSFPKPPCPNLPQECNAVMFSSSNMDSSVLPAEPCPTHLTISKIENPNLNIWFNFPHCPLLGRGGNGAQNSPSTMYRFLSFLPGRKLRQPGKAALDGTVTTDLMSPRTMHLPVTDRKT